MSSSPLQELVAWKINEKSNFKQFKVALVKFSSDSHYCLIRTKGEAKYHGESAAAVEKLDEWKGHLTHRTNNIFQSGVGKIRSKAKGYRAVMYRSVFMVTYGGKLTVPRKSVRGKRVKTHTCLVMSARVPIPLPDIEALTPPSYCLRPPHFVFPPTCKHVRANKAKVRLNQTVNKGLKKAEKQLLMTQRPEVTRRPKWRMIY